MGRASIRAQELLDTSRMDVTQQLQAAEKELPAHLVILSPLPAPGYHQKTFNWKTTKSTGKGCDYMFKCSCLNTHT